MPFRTMRFRTYHFTDSVFCTRLAVGFSAWFTKTSCTPNSFTLIFSNSVIDLMACDTPPLAIWFDVGVLRTCLKTKGIA